MPVVQLPGQRLRAGSLPPHDPDPRGGHVEVRDLSVGYGSGVVVRGVSLEAQPGQVICILGRNGAGKTTLLNSIVGIHPTPRESVFLDGGDASRAPSYARARAGVGYVPQGRRIFGHLTCSRTSLSVLRPRAIETQDSSTRFMPCSRCSRRWVAVRQEC
jgi:ABC-type branched-subunit amino acid transport system ATPase component